MVGILFSEIIASRYHWLNITIFILFGLDEKEILLVPDEIILFYIEFDALCFFSVVICNMYVYLMFF